MYPSQKTFNDFPSKLKELLNIKQKKLDENNINSFAEFTAFEIVISCFLKEYKMRKENEFRSIEFSNSIVEDDILVEIIKGKFNLDLEDPNEYYSTAEDIKTS